MDAIIAVTGKVHYGLVTETTAEQFRLGLNDKLLGQIDLALIGQRFLNDGGSITLTSGIVAQHPIRIGSNMSPVNAALEGFAMAAAGELARGQRINVVSPTLLEEAVPIYGLSSPGSSRCQAAGSRRPTCGASRASSLARCTGCGDRLTSQAHERGVRESNADFPPDRSATDTDLLHMAGADRRVVDSEEPHRPP